MSLSEHLFTKWTHKCSPSLHLICVVSCQSFLALDSHEGTAQEVMWNVHFRVLAQVWICCLVVVILTELTHSNLKELKTGWEPLERSRRIMLELNLLSSRDDKGFHEELTDESGHLSLFWIMSRFFPLAEKHMGCEEIGWKPAVSVPLAILPARGGEVGPYEQRWFEGNLGVQLKRTRSSLVSCPLMSAPLLSTGVPQKAVVLVQQRWMLVRLRNLFCFLFFNVYLLETPDSQEMSHRTYLSCPYTWERHFPSEKVVRREM